MVAACREERQLADGERCSDLDAQLPAKAEGRAPAQLWTSWKLPADSEHWPEPRGLVPARQSHRRVGSATTTTVPSAGFLYADKRTPDATPPESPWLGSALLQDSSLHASRVADSLDHDREQLARSPPIG